MQQILATLVVVAEERQRCIEGEGYRCSQVERIIRRKHLHMKVTLWIWLKQIRDLDY